MYYLLIFFVIGICLQFFLSDLTSWIKKVNKYVLYLPLPAVTFLNIYPLHIQKELWIPVGSAWIIFFLALLFFGILWQLKYIDKATFACLTLVCGLGNTSFVGYPIITTLIDKDALKYAVLVDQPGTFFALSTFGVILANLASTGKIHPIVMLRRLFSFPPFLAFFIALILPKSIFINSDIFNFICKNILSPVGATLLPMALLSLGMQFSFAKNSFSYSHFSLGILFKCILAPLFILLLLLGRDNQIGKMELTTILEIGMPPMITASVLAIEYNLQPKLANALAILGLPIGILLVTIWFFIIS